MSAENGTSAEQSAATADVQQTASTESNLPPVDAGAMSQMMQRLGIPNAMRPEIEAEQPETEAQPQEPEPEPTEVEAVDDPIQPEAEQEETTAEPEEETGEEVDDPEPKPEEGKSPEVLKLERRNWKLRQKRRADKAELEQTRAELSAVKAQLETAAPINVIPTIDNPLAAVTNLQELEVAKAQFRALRDTARANPHGWVDKDGTEITAEQSQQRLSYAEDVLTDLFPMKEAEIKAIRPASEAEARRILPTMFDKSTKDGQAAQTFWRMNPQIAASPQRDYLTAVFLRGFQSILAEQPQKNGEHKNGKLEIPEKIRKAHEQRETTVVQKQTPPGRAVTAPRANQAMTEAMQRVDKSGGSRESVKEALKSYGPISANNGKAPALV